MPGTMDNIYDNKDILQASSVQTLVGVSLFILKGPHCEKNKWKNK